MNDINDIMVEKGIPLPTSKQSAWPLNSMEVGDSFSVEPGKQVQLRSAISYERVKGSMKKFTVLTLPNEIRCWRVS